MAENRWSFVSETIEDNTKLPVSTEFIKTWVIKNAGDTTWTRDYKLKFASNEMMSSQTSFPLSADVPPGGQAVLTVPMVAPHKVGNYMSHWQLVDASGTALKSATTSGTTFLWLKIKVVPADEIVEPLKEDISFWIWESETIADNTSLASGAKFTKTWTFRNAGPATWTKDYSIGFVGKDSKNQLAPEARYPFPKDVAVDEAITLTVPMIVPETKGTYRSDWALFDAQGNAILMKSKKKIMSFWAKIKAIPQSEIKGSKWILLDETIPDGEGITIESKFDKTWIFRNVGRKSVV